jgi:pyrroloquinoline quinone (PQQ) biosynthesis protein C
MNPNLVKDLYTIAEGCVEDVRRHPALASMLTGTATLQTIDDWTAQSYNYVKSTVPSLVLAAEQLEQSGKYPHLVAYFRVKRREEHAHDDWLLEDRRAAGLSARPEDMPPPSAAVEAYVRFNEAMILTGSPIAYLGTSFVLEHLAARLAGVAAERLVAAGAAPACAVGFLSEHGHADVAHVAGLAAVVKRIDDPGDAEAIRLCARVTAAMYPRFFAPL